MSNQVFISYRREGGGDVAQLIQEKLKNEGYSVFLDINSIHRGKFDKKILVAIEECDDFILILSKGALDRCDNADDWVRAEIKHALLHNKNIIPIMLPGATFPENLPADIAAVKKFNGIDYNRMHLNSVINMLMHEWMISEPQKKEEPVHYSPSTPTPSRSFISSLPKKPIIISVAVLIAIGLCVLIFSLTNLGRQTFCSHSYITNSVLPTCNESGLNSLDCSKCAHHEENVIPALGHSFVNWTIDYDATETDPGTKHSFCERCDERKDITFYLSASEGLEYERVGDHVVLVGIGSFTNEKIVIPPMVDGYPVTEIGAKAFRSNKVITSVIIPEGIVTINSKAFANCLLLKEIVLPSTLTTIGREAFLGCEIESLTIPENVKVIENWAFESCTALKTLTMSKNVEKFGLFALSGLYKLETINYDGTLEEWREQYRFRVDFLYMNRVFDINCTDGSFSIIEHLKNMFK